MASPFDFTTDTGLEPEDSEVSVRSPVSALNEDEVRVQPPDNVRVSVHERQSSERPVRRSRMTLQALVEGPNVRSVVTRHVMLEASVS